jgi:hypothetical protein
LSLLVAIIETLACFGLGVLVVRPLGLARWLAADEVLTWAFALGFGVLGWLVFMLGWAGMFQTGPLAAVLFAGLLGLPLLRAEFAACRRALTAWSPGRIGWLLVAVAAAALALDAIEAVPPPTDADSLAYHFALPKAFLAAGRIEFVPRAIDGAVPMLVNMTYVPALGLGGERALTLWTMLSGWCAAALVFALCRRHLPPEWSLTAALVFLTTPAVAFGAGSGQVEVRLVLFAVIGAHAVALALKTGDWRFAVVAGLGAGFFMGGKYTGQLFAASAGAVILCQRQWLRHGLIMAAAGALAGCQWYLWNWAHTGDPVFPMLYDQLKGMVDYRYWDQGHADYLKTHYFATETPLAKSLYGLFAYPFIATLAGPPQFDSGRTGLGPLVLLALPFIALALWTHRTRILRHELFPAAVIVAIFYALWFLSGSSQRVRHMLPVYPLLILGTCVAMHRWAGTRRKRPMALVFAATLAVHAGALALFSLNSIAFVFSGESRGTYLERTLSNYIPIPWINANLGPHDRLFTLSRQSLYLLEVPFFYGIPFGQAQVDLRDGKATVERVASEIAALRITHFLLPLPLASLSAFYGRMVEKGCLVPMRRFKTTRVRSRTLSTFSDPLPAEAMLFRFDPAKCQN